MSADMVTVKQTLDRIAQELIVQSRAIDHRAHDYNDTDPNRAFLLTQAQDLHGLAADVADIGYSLLGLSKP